MKEEDVLAVVVSYNGREQLRHTVDALRHQVGRVHVVDNGSGADSLRILDALEREPSVTVERLGANRGIGHALNVGVQRAREGGFAWLLTMDQDSVIGPGMVDAYRAAIERDPTLVCLAPTMEKNGVADEVGGSIAYAITSGNLVRADLFAEVGLYDEGFFIDCIDFDFCLRVRRAGHRIHRVPDALMTHRLGDAVDLPPIARRYYARHSPVRRYYMYRNYLYLAERYFRAFPAFMLKLTLSQLLLTVLIGFLDPSPSASYRAMARGIRDYAARRAGPLALPAR